MIIYAHRGYSGRYPENTMIAFEKAVEAGCDGIELDVQFTKDNEVVIIHDELVDRTTNGVGWVKDFTLEELKKLDASKLWDNVEFASIPTLKEYLEWVKDIDIITNIELKTSVYYYTGIEKAVLDMIAEYGIEDKILISSFNLMSVVKTQELNPNIKVGALIGAKGGIGKAGEFCKEFKFDCYHPSYNGLNSNIIKECKENNVEVNVWTVNEMDGLENLVEWGCDGVFTNYPSICKKFLK